MDMNFDRAVWRNVASMALVLALVLFAGCAMPEKANGGAPDGSPPGGFADALDQWAARAGLSPEGMAAAGEATGKAAPYIPSPAGDIAKVLAGVLGAGGVGWGAYRKRKKEAIEAGTARDDFADALKSVTDFIDALPEEIRKPLIPALKAKQKKDGTRETIRAIRG